MTSYYKNTSCYIDKNLNSYFLNKGYVNENLLSSPLLSSPLLSSPLLSSPLPYAPQAKVGSNTNANHARSGHLFQDGKRVLDSAVFRKTLEEVFHPVLNEKGKGLLPQLVDTFANHETEHLDYVPKRSSFDKEKGSFSRDCFGVEADCLHHYTTNSRNRILLSPHSFASREELKTTPQTHDTEMLSAWLDKYEKRGHEEFPVVAQELIDGKPASIRR